MVLAFYQALSQAGWGSSTGPSLHHQILVPRKFRIGEVEAVQDLVVIEPGCGPGLMGEFTRIGSLEKEDRRSGRA